MEHEGTDNKGWKSARGSNTLPEVFSSINIPQGKNWLKKLFAFSGPGMMVAVGYMDPGNWATDIAGGAQFGYTLLSVIFLSNIFAIILQYLALKLGIATGRDLAQACRDNYAKPISIFLWILCEIAIAACDLAEVIGSAIALNLLFGIPLVFGVAITILDVLLILFFQTKGFRWLEAVVASLIVVIFVCFGYEIIVSKPEFHDILMGLVPSTKVVVNPGMLYIAIGILGATVMPHNLYLHSSIVQTRNFDRNDSGRKMALKYATIDSTLSLLLAFFINAAILIMAAATFHNTAYHHVADISDAYHLLDPLLGVKVAGVLFAVALLASGQNSTLTGTLAGQIVMEGFIDIKLKPWLRRLITRLLAVVPALVVTIIAGEKGTGQLLVLSQVVLSMQLSFAVVPLVVFTNDREKMGAFVNNRPMKIAAWTITAIIIALNGWLLLSILRG
jgi:manganese transport protein